MRRLLILLLTTALAAGACGDSDDSGDGGDGAADVSAGQPEVTGELGAKPTVVVPEGAPPTELVIEDLVEGDGDEAKAGTSVTVHYVGVSWSTGEQFDASWDRGEPFTLATLPGPVIDGWNEGLVGMKVGGRRLLVIPPEQAYGPDGRPPVIGPSETLVFVIDLVAVGDPAGAGE